MTWRGHRLLGLLGVVVLCCLCVSDTGAQRRWRRRVEPMERSIFPSNSFTFCKCIEAKQDCQKSKKNGRCAHVESSLG